ncbi:MAG TPA: hypothetical protein VFI41_04825 [Gemmatimonadales bacterium]|nr:hypothetical protein [Gemmatimonadales bacterium]
MDYVVKKIEMACGCGEELRVRPRESRTLLKVGQTAHCLRHGDQEITQAEEIAGNVPLLKELLDQ